MQTEPLEVLRCPRSGLRLRVEALLDTFDWLPPEYDNPQSAPTVRSWLEQSGLVEGEVLKAGHLTARGTAAHAAWH